VSPPHLSGPLEESSPVRVADCGDSGLLATISGGSAEENWLRARSVADAVLSAQLAGLVDVLASYASVFVAFDPLTCDRERLRAVLVAGAVAGSPSCRGQELLVPVVYGGDFGADLAGVAHEWGTDAGTVVQQHVATTWTVRLLGSPLGMPMMDRPATGPALARLAEPRVRVPVGSVGLSGHQCVVYPTSSPGGWRLIGRTPVRLVDLLRDPVAPYGPGDRLRFLPVEESEWDAWSADLAAVQDRLRERACSRD
jgi:KipI family sensor histidine kinase inhibitor